MKSDSRVTSFELCLNFCSFPPAESQQAGHCNTRCRTRSQRIFLFPPRSECSRASVMKCKCSSTVWVKPRKRRSPRSRLVVHVKRASLAYSQDKCRLREYARVPGFVQGLSSPQRTVAWGSFSLKANACTGRRGTGGGAVV